MTLTAAPSQLPQTGFAGRLAWLDLARGVALVAMAIYHFTWDLAVFGVIPPGTPFETPWVIFARTIAGSFLFLVGLGLVIGHGRGIRWRSFSRRLAKIVLAAAVITVATLFATPDAYIFFGILHMIAAGSLAGLLLVQAPWFVALGVAAVTAWLGLANDWTFFDDPALVWLGLGTEPVRSNDFVPFLPFFAAIALGIAVARLACLHQRGARGPAPSGEDVGADVLPARILRFLGRNSLIVYLAHQPVLIAILWFTLWAGGSLPGS